MLKDYGYEDTLYWTMQNLYRDSSQLWNQVDLIWADLDVLFRETYYGFHEMVFTSRVETYYNPSVTVPITYTIRSNVTIPSAKIGIRDVTAGFSQVLRTQTISADTSYRFTDYVTFNRLGRYNMQLALFRSSQLATPNPGPTIYQSTYFDVDVVDLADLIEDSTIELVLPNNWGNNFSNPSNPPNDDISWHKPGLIYIEAVLGNNTPLTDNSCEVYYYSNINPLGRLLLSGLKINKSTDVPFCAGNILSTMMDQGDEGVYNVEVEQEFISSYDQTDYMRLGIDDVNPIIYSIIPSVGYYSGVLLVQVNTTDSLSGVKTSGVKTVWVSLINKEDNSVNYSAEAFNKTTGYFETEFNTTALGVSDGGYDITVNVTDIAGNSAEATVDPSIDNTPPSISLLDVPASMCVGKTSTLKAIVVDLLSGVCSKNATLTLPNGSVMDLTFAGDNLAYTPATNLSGFHNLTITAADCAIIPNNMTNVSEHNITVVDCPVPAAPEAPSKGGGGGSGCYSRISCGEWSDCVNGEQTRTCTDYVCHILPDTVQTKGCALFVGEEAAALPAPALEEAKEALPEEAKMDLLKILIIIAIIGIIGVILSLIRRYELNKHGGHGHNRLKKGKK